MSASRETTVPLLLDLWPSRRDALSDFVGFRELVRTLLSDVSAFALYRVGPGEHVEPVESIGYPGDRVRAMAERLDGVLAEQAWTGATELPVDRVKDLDQTGSGTRPRVDGARLLRGATRVSGVLAYSGEPGAGTLDAEKLSLVGHGLEAHVELAHLLRSYEFARGVLRDVPTGVIAIDTLGRVIFMNAAAERAVGVAASDAIGADSLRVFRTPVDGENLLLDAHGGDRPAMEVWVRRADGAEIPVELVRSRIRARDGAVLGAVGMFQNLSELRSVQERMRQRDRLATIGELAAGIAHEIGNPLTGIRGCAQILRDRLDPEDESQELIGVILEEVDRLNRLSDQVRHYGRPREPRMRKGPVTEAVDRVLAVMAPAAEEAGISIVRSEVDDLPEIYHDSDQIQQVLQNLVRNAIDAMERGGRLEIELERVKRKLFSRPMGRRAGDRFEPRAARVERDYVNVRVTDDGPGIPEDVQERIFNPFFTTKPHGLGLGLSLSQTIVSEHGGVLSVMSQPEKGTTFSLDLPVDRRAK